MSQLHKIWNSCGVFHGPCLWHSLLNPDSYRNISCRIFHISIDLKFMLLRNIRFSAWLCLKLLKKIILLGYGENLSCLLPGAGGLNNVYCTTAAFLVQSFNTFPCYSQHRMNNLELRLPALFYFLILF